MAIGRFSVAINGANFLIKFCWGNSVHQGDGGGLGDQRVGLLSDVARGAGGAPPVTTN